MKRIYLNNFSPLKFVFSQNENDFKVTEIPIDFRGKGNFLILKVKKKNLSTWDMLKIIANSININPYYIGYAGLKDKYATTIQYISIPFSFHKEIKKIRHKNIDILETFKHNKPIKMGDLKGNKFEITLRKVTNGIYEEITKRINLIKQQGIPNYFGYQRFGKGDSFEKAKAVVLGEEILRDKKLEKFLVHLYQSYYFNKWLSVRVKMSDDRFKLLKGEVYKDMKTNKYFISKDILEDRFIKKEVTPTGLLMGKKTLRAIDEAGKIEDKYSDDIFYKGDRRAAWIWIDDMKYKYNKSDKSLKLSFSLPKGSYATVVIEAIANRNLEA